MELKFLPQNATRPRRSRRLMRGVLLFAVVPYLAVTAIFTLFQRSLIYRPVRSAPLHALGENFSPHTARDVTVQSVDGLPLHGWLIESNRSRESESGPGERRLVVYFPGNSGHREMRRRDLLEIANFGFDVLIVDYRGYAENEGRPNENQLSSDARSVWEFTIREAGYGARNVVVFGESLGGAVAIRMCADLGDGGPALLIVASTFSSLPDVVSWTYPAFPFRYLLWDRFDSAAWIARVRSRFVVIHGDQDEFVPVEIGRRLFEMAPESSSDGSAKRWKLVNEMGHNDIPVSLLREVLID